MLEYWNNGMVPFGQNLAPLRSAIGMLEDWKFFKTVLIIPYNNEKLLRGVQGGGFLEKSPPGRRRQ
jgi:hypothetical protein